MAQAFGPEFLKSLNAELDELSQSGSDRGKDRPAPQQTSGFRLRGKPGSAERMRQVAEHTQDPSLIAELAWESVGTALQNALHQIRADEQRDDFYGEHDAEPNYRPQTVEAFTSAVRLIASTGDPQLYAAFANELGAESPLQEYLPAAVEFAETKGRIESYELAKASEEQRLSERERVLNQEYQDIARRTGPAGLAAADQLASNLNEEGVLYHPHADEDHLRADLRAVSEHAKATERGLRQAAFLTEFNEEVIRRHGPGSSWTDDEREKWEQDQRTATVETINRVFGSPEDHADRAIGGMIEDDQRRATGKSSFERALDAEIDKQYQHSRQGSPHLNELAESNAREWAETHDESGHPLTTRDGQGRESEGRRR